MNTRIRAVRDYYDLTRAEFGQRIGVSGDVINNLERGRVEPKEWHILSICREFSINPDWLRTGEGTMFESKEPPFIADLKEDREISDADMATINTYLELPEVYKEMFATYIHMLHKREQDEMARYLEYLKALKKTDDK